MPRADKNKYITKTQQSSSITLMLCVEQGKQQVSIICLCNHRLGSNP